MATNKSTKTGLGWLVLFALPFAAAGTGMGVWQGCEIVAHWRMQSWDEIDAKIVWAKLETHRGSKGGTTYEVKAEYTYRYRNRQYTGSQVGIQGGNGKMDSVQENMHRQLSEQQKSGRPFHCYVNPAQPTEAILFRDLRWEQAGLNMIFAMVFGAVGFGMLTFVALGYRKAKAEFALAALHPDEPWLCKKEWSDGKINSSAKTYVIAMLAFTFFWNLISAPALLVFRHEAFVQGNRLVFLVLAFPAVGLILILGVIVSVLRLRKYGRSVFEMASVPGVIGGQLAGVIRTSAKVRPEEGFRLTLNCVQKSQTGSGNSRRISENVLWQDEQLIARELQQNDPEKSAIPVLFQIPYECRPTDDTNANDQTIWRLEASAKTPGLDYSTSFDVPVFKTPESDPNFVVDRSLIAKYAAPEDLDRDLHEAGVLKTQSPTGEGCRLVFPMARTPGTAAMMTLLGLIFGAVPFIMFYLGAEWWINTLFGIVFALAGLVLLAFSADVWFYRSVIDVSARGLTIVGGWFGRGREQRIEVADIVKIVPISHMSSGEGQGAKVYYDIVIVCSAGKKITAGKRVVGQRLAASVIRQIEQAMGK